MIEFLNAVAVLGIMFYLAGRIEMRSSRVAIRDAIARTNDLAARAAANPSTTEA